MGKAPQLSKRNVRIALKSIPIRETISNTETTVGVEFVLLANVEEIPINPWAVVIVLFGILVMVVGWRGTQGNVVNALKGSGSITPSPLASQG